MLICTSFCYFPWNLLCSKPSTTPFLVNRTEQMFNPLVREKEKISFSYFPLVSLGECSMIQLPLSTTDTLYHSITFFPARYRFPNPHLFYAPKFSCKHEIPQLMRGLRILWKWFANVIRCLQSPTNPWLIVDLFIVKDINPLQCHAQYNCMNDDLNFRIVYNFQTECFHRLVCLCKIGFVVA